MVPRKNGGDLSPQFIGMQTWLGEQMVHLPCWLQSVLTLQAAPQAAPWAHDPLTQAVHSPLPPQAPLLEQADPQMPVTQVPLAAQ